MLSARDERERERKLKRAGRSWITLQTLYNFVKFGSSLSLFQQKDHHYHIWLGRKGKEMGRGNETVNVTRFSQEKEKEREENKRETESSFTFLHLFKSGIRAEFERKEIDVWHSFPKLFLSYLFFFFPRLLLKLFASSSLLERSSVYVNRGMNWDVILFIVED